MPGYTYPDWITAVGLLLEVDVVSSSSSNPFSNQDYNNAVPRAIEYAEQRIYRELDLLLTRTEDITATFTPNSRTLTLPDGGGWIIGQTLLGSPVGLGPGTGVEFIVLEQVAFIAGGKKQPPLTPVSKNTIDQLWPDDTAPSTPSYPNMWAPVDQQSIRVGPPPDAAYQAILFGTYRPAPLSSSNESTLLTLYLPDLFLQASMIFWAELQRDLVPGSDQSAISADYEAKYIGLRDSAITEEARKKLQSSGWSSRLPSPIVSPPMN